MGTRPAVDDLTVRLGAGVSILADLFMLEVADSTGSFEKSAGLARDICEDWSCAPVLLRLALLDRPHGAVELRKPRAFPARDIIVLGVIALDQDALAGPAADQRRLRTVCRHIATARTNACDHRARRASPRRTLFPLPLPPCPFR